MLFLFFFVVFFVVVDWCVIHRDENEKGVSLMMIARQEEDWGRRRLRKERKKRQTFWRLPWRLPGGWAGRIWASRSQPWQPAFPFQHKLHGIPIIVVVVVVPSQNHQHQSLFFFLWWWWRGKKTNKGDTRGLDHVEVRSSLVVCSDDGGDTKGTGSRHRVPVHVRWHSFFFCCCFFQFLFLFFCFWWKWTNLSAKRWPGMGEL